METRLKQPNLSKYELPLPHETLNPGSKIRCHSYNNIIHVLWSIQERWQIFLWNLGLAILRRQWASTGMGAGTCVIMWNTEIDDWIKERWRKKKLNQLQTQLTNGRTRLPKLQQHLMNLIQGKAVIELWSWHDSFVTNSDKSPKIGSILMWCLTIKHVGTFESKGQTL